MGLSIYAMMRAIGHPIDLLGYPIKKNTNWRYDLRKTTINIDKQRGRL